MAYIEREIVIHEPYSDGLGYDTSQSNYDWSSSYQSDDPLERLDRARLDRGDFYRRMENTTTKNLSVFDSPVRGPSPDRLAIRHSESSGEKRISDGGPSVDSLPRVPEPHTSWRFYTSYDNGEWKRHMVPVYHSEDDVLNTSSTIGVRSGIRSDSESSSYMSGALSPSFGLETNIRRMRIGRPSVYETLQNRRRRCSEGVKRLQGPRSADVILNSVSYMTPDEVKRRYDVKDYVPRRKTEYGERVIYPRVPISPENKSKLASVNTQPQKDFEEVTRTVHPSYTTIAKSSNEITKIDKPLPPPVTDYGYQEKVIVPTKYKSSGGINSPPLQQPKTILDLLDDSINTVSPRTLSPRRTTVERYVEPIQSYNVHYVSNHNHSPSYRTEVTHQNISKSSDNNFERRSRADDIDKPMNYQPIIRPRENSATRDREVKVVVVKNSEDQPNVIQEQPPNIQSSTHQQFQQHQTEPKMQQQNLYQQQPQQQRHQQSTHSSIVHDNKQPTNVQQLSTYVPKQRSTTTSVASSRAEELAAQVRSGTINAMQQMQSQMVEDMKNKCPEAAEAMATLMSGGDKDTTMEKKEAFAEQVSLWQGGRPLEEKLIQETRYKSNDPISGPQDYVERSTITRDSESGFQTVISSPYNQQTQYHHHQYKHHPEQHLQITSNNRLVSDYQPSSVFYSPDHRLDKMDNTGMPVGFSNESDNRQTIQNVSQHNISRQQQNSNRKQQNFSPEFEYAPERKNDSGDKIIIPTKYRNAESKPMSVKREHDNGFENYIAICPPYEPHRYNDNNYNGNGYISDIHFISVNSGSDHPHSIPQSSNYSSSSTFRSSRVSNRP